MSLLTVEELTHSYGDKKVLGKIGFRLQKGEHVGLVGANGAGKTTLFSILMGDLTPDSGRIEWLPGVGVGHLSQHGRLVPGRTIRDTLKEAFGELYAAETELQIVSEQLAQASGTSEEPKLLRRMSVLQDLLYTSGFYGLEERIEEASRGLGIMALGLETPVDELSGGQRTKVLLAQLLLESPDVLLLDEPTNYLDKAHVEWLVDYLAKYQNSFIVISHDTGFINRVVNVIYHLEFTNLKRYPGNYDKFVAQKDKNAKQHIARFERQQEAIAKLEDFVRRNIARASTTRRAQSRRKQLEKIERIERPQVASKPVFSFNAGRSSSSLVLRSKGLLIGYVRPLLPALNLKLERGSKVAITGRNGIGKSTLLKTMIGVLPALRGNFEMGDNLEPAYFAQEVPPSRDATVLQDVWREFPTLSQKEVRQSLARCGLKPEMMVLRPSELSGGEQARVRLCKLMMAPSNWLLLDEPINHLDAVAREALQEALRKYEGTVLIVCHEAWFFEDWATEVWDVEGFQKGGQRPVFR